MSIYVISLLFIVTNYSLASQDLVNFLMTNYTPEAAPTAPVMVRMSLVIQDLIEISEKYETLKINEWRCFYWNDHRLSWEQMEAFKNISMIALPHSKVWKPDVRLYNLIEREEIVQDLDVIQVRIGSNGDMNYCQPEISTVRCRMNVAMLPFDEQRCLLQYESWSQGVQQMRLQLINPEQLVKDGFGSSEWIIEDFDIIAGESHYLEGLVVRTYDGVKVTLVLARIPSYYFWVIVIPSLVLTTLNMIGVFAPFNAGGERQEKVTLGLTTLLAMTVMMQIVTDSIPRSSHGLPLLAKYILFEIFMTVGVTTLAVLIMFINHSALSHEWHVPPCLITILCLRKKKTRQNDKQRKQSNILEEARLLNEDLSEVGTKRKHRSRSSSTSKRRSAAPADDKSDDKVVVFAVQKLQQSIDVMNKSLTEEKHTGEREKTWNMALDRLDIILMFIFIIVNTVLTAILFMFPRLVMGWFDYDDQ